MHARSGTDHGGRAFDPVCRSPRENAIAPVRPTAATLPGPPIRCEACGRGVRPFDVVHASSSEDGAQTLCSRCFNEGLAERCGLIDFAHADFDPIEMVDAGGHAHCFHFRTQLFGSGVAVEAFELRGDEPCGYRFQSIGEPEEDLHAVLGRLVAKMRRALAVRHLEPGASGWQVTDRLRVRGTIDGRADAHGRGPVVVVDGREISWADFGRIVSAFEGWQFRLEFFDRSDEP